MRVLDGIRRQSPWSLLRGSRSALSWLALSEAYLFCDWGMLSHLDVHNEAVDPNEHDVTLLQKLEPELLKDLACAVLSEPTPQLDRARKVRCRRELSTTITGRPFLPTAASPKHEPFRKCSRGMVVRAFRLLLIFDCFVCCCAVTAVLLQLLLVGERVQRGWINFLCQHDRCCRWIAYCLKNKKINK